MDKSIYGQKSGKKKIQKIMASWFVLQISPNFEGHFVISKFKLIVQQNKFYLSFSKIGLGSTFGHCMFWARTPDWHIVPHRKFDRIGGTSSATFPNLTYVATREICVERNCYDSPIAKWELEQIFDVGSSRAVP